MIPLNIRIYGVMTPEKIQAIEFINMSRTPVDELELDEVKWINKIGEVSEKFNVHFDFSITDTKEVVLTERGYVEPEPDKMQTYNSEMQTFNSIKTTHELGLITDEEFIEAEEYMKSLYPSEVAKFSLTRKPEWFDKFKYFF